MGNQDTPATSGRALRVLFCGEHHWPELISNGKYSGEIVDFLASRGHRMTVVTAQPHYPEWAIHSPARNTYSRETVGGVEIHRSPLFLKRPMRGIWRLIAPATFGMFASPIILWRALVERPDVIVCVVPTMSIGPAVWVAARLVGAGTVLHVQDLEVDAALAVGHIGPGLLQRAALAAEAWLMRRFDTVITISDRMADRLRAKRVKNDRLRVIRNWVDLDAIRPLSGPNAYRRLLLLPDDSFVVLYAGAIGKKQVLHVVLDAAGKLVDRPGVRFVIAGEGPELVDLKARYGGLPNVQFLPLQPADRLCELLNLADLHVLPQDRGVADLVLPSKLGGVLASGRRLAVMADPGTELHAFLGDVGILVEPGNAEALAVAIEQASKGERNTYEPGRRLADRLDARTNLAEFEAALIETAQSD